jgi:hypothetical protein
MPDRPHIADESWELDHGCDSVLWCGHPLLRGVNPRGVDLPEVWTLEVWNSRGMDLTAYSAYLGFCFRAAACIAFYSQM